MASFACPLGPSYKASIHLDGTAHIVLAFASWPRHDAIVDVAYAIGAGLESVAVVGEGATVLRTRFDRGAQVVTFELRGVNAASSGAGGGHHFTFTGRPIEGGTALLRPPEQISCPALAPLPPPPRPPPSAPPPPAPPPHACALDVRYTLTRQLSAAEAAPAERGVEARVEVVWWQAGSRLTLGSTRRSSTRRRCRSRGGTCGATCRCSA